MSQKEINEIISDLSEGGFEPQLCDTMIPLETNPVRAGHLTGLGNQRQDGILIPYAMIGMSPQIMLTVKGDSMVDVGIDDGDLVRLSVGKMPRSGDIVAVRVNGEYTIKSYFEDDNGCHWIVPQNSEREDEYRPVQLDGAEDVEIYGVIDEVMKGLPRASNRSMRQKVTRAKRAMAVTVEIPETRVSLMIRELGKEIGVARQWFSVYRPMVDLSLISEEDYDGFCDRVRLEVPAHQHLPSGVELSRMAVGSFAKSVNLWDEHNAPVTGMRFRRYKHLAERAIAIMTGEEEP